MLSNSFIDCGNQENESFVRENEHLQQELFSQSVLDVEICQRLVDTAFLIRYLPPELKCHKSEDNITIKSLRTGDTFRK